MTETTPATAVFYGSSSPEKAAPPKKEESRIVKGVKKAVDSWLDRIGTKNVERHFIKTHENILATLTNDQRKEVFAKEAEKWQKEGKAWGIAATVIDLGLIGTGAGLSFIGLRNPQHGADLYTSCVSTISRFAMDHNYRNPTVIKALQKLVQPFDQDILSKHDQLVLSSEKIDSIGRNVAIAPAIAAVTMLITSGPGHTLAHMVAGFKESTGRTAAHAHNYVDSGKAAEHAKAVGNTIGKGITETVKYAAEHPDEIRKTVETVSRVSQETRDQNQKIKVAQQKAADAKLDAEYNDWIAHHPDKAYYQNSGQPMPSKAEYVEMKRREAAAKKANDELQKRNSHFEL
jgi:hypothetical protein